MIVFMEINQETWEIQAVAHDSTICAQLLKLAPRHEYAPKFRTAIRIRVRNLPIFSGLPFYATCKTLFSPPRTVRCST